MKVKNCFLILVSAVLFIACGNSSEKFLRSETIDFSNGKWNEFYLGEASGDSFNFNKDGLSLELSKKGIYGVYNSTPIAGQFLLEAEFSEDKNIDLMLFFEKNGQPDLNNYTGIQVETNRNKKVVVRVIDRQNGKDNVLDNTGKLLQANAEGRRRFNNDDYEHTLTGKEYSVPFTKTGGKVRIFFDAAAGFFHYYYSVEKTIRGKKAENWMELASSRFWGLNAQKFLFALAGHKKGASVFQGVSVEQKPTGDKDDRKTGFAVVRREYNWSGFFGDAVVISFDDNFKFHNKDIKFVFWSEMNYIPAWHINNQLLYTYEFVETWGGGNLGCHEPMSDRLLRWSNVKILEDNNVRKVVRWHYVLINPQYKIPDDSIGTQLAEVDEYWTFYPDGTGTRYIRYTPKLDSGFEEPHEVAELIAIAGSSSNTVEHFDSPALTILNLQGRRIDTHPGPKFDFDSEINDWKQQISIVHFKNEPDFYCAFSADPQFPDTYSGYKLEYQNTWHNTDQILIHWPVQKRPYTCPNGSRGYWKSEISHACLTSIDIHDGTDWSDNFKVDERGRKYRDWVMLVGAVEKKSENEIKLRTISWLDPGKIAVMSSGAEFVKINHREKALVFKVLKDVNELNINLIPGYNSVRINNPAIKIFGWGKEKPTVVKLNNKKIDAADYRTSVIDNNDLLVWLKTDLTSDSEITIEK